MREANKVNLHAGDAYGQPACRHDGDVALAPELITCGNPPCKAVRSAAAERERNRRARDPSLAQTPARKYALTAYLLLETEQCPGGEGHEGRGGKDYCAACIIGAIEAAWNAGRGR